MKIALAALALMPVAAIAAPQIGEVHWPGIRSYCTFTEAGHAFVFDDPDSWRFVFFTGFPEEGRDLMARSFMVIDNQLRELALLGVKTADGVETRAYASHDNPPYEIVLTAQPGEPGYEATAYAGRIEVSYGGEATSVDFEGDCGV